MKIEIPELKNYNGCKGGNGVYQQIISLIPPHEILVIPFLGHCGIVRNIAPAKTLICIDASAKVINAWKQYLLGTLNYEVAYDDKNIFIKTFESKGNLPEVIHLLKRDSIEFLKSRDFKNISIGNKVVIYLDPPYPFSSRKSQVKLYDCEMTDKQHKQLLSIILKMDDQYILISTRQNEMYIKYLSNWKKHSFSVGTRNGKAIETVYYNFNIDNGLLHDYRYLGNNYKDRERIKLKVNRWINRLYKLPPREKQAILRSLILKNMEYSCYPKK